MNAVDNATLERIYGYGKRQRKYVGKISVVAQELADLVIAAAVSCENSQGVYWISFTEDDNVTDCEIRQSDNIMSVSMLSFGANPAMWPRNYYKLGKTITEYIVSAIAAKGKNSLPEAQSNHPESAASETPANVPDRTQDERSYSTMFNQLVCPNCGYANWDKRQLQSAGITVFEDGQFQSFAECVCAKCNHIHSYDIDSSDLNFPVIPQPLAELEALRQQVAKLEGDLKAAQAIIIDAGAKVETAKRIALNLAEKNAQTRKEVQAVIDRLGKDIDESNSILAPRIAHYRLELKKAIATDKASVEAPKKVISARMRIRWNERGFSSGDYEVLGYSNEKQAYVLNISSDAQKPMPKWVKFSDCQ